MRLYVGNISPETSESGLAGLFRQVGTVDSIEITRDFAFMEMPSAAEAENAIAQLDGRELEGRSIRVLAVTSGSGHSDLHPEYAPAGFPSGKSGYGSDYGYMG